MCICFVQCMCVIRMEVKETNFPLELVTVISGHVKEKLRQCVEAPVNRKPTYVYMYIHVHVYVHVLILYSLLWKYVHVHVHQSQLLLFFWGLTNVRPDVSLA